MREKGRCNGIENFDKWCRWPGLEERKSRSSKGMDKMERRESKGVTKNLHNFIVYTTPSNIESEWGGAITGKCEVCRMISWN